ncbi:MAG: type II toxin-antitoxin system ParD family antitoxin [Candidatus Gastranaerophilaceae bacterium]
MNISLTPALEQYMQEKISSGLYNSVSEIIREALRLLVAKEKVEKNRIELFNREIEKGLFDIEKGNIQNGSIAIKNLMGKYDI